MRLERYVESVVGRVPWWTHVGMDSDMVRDLSGVLLKLAGPLGLSFHGVLLSSGIMRRAVWASVALVCVQFLVAFYLYPRMPERVAIHWGLSGEADGYGSRFLGLFLVPIVSLVFLPFLVALPRLDPSRGIERFRGGYDWFVFGFMAYMAYVYGLSLAWNLDWRFSFMRMLAPAVGALFVGIGVVLRGARLNWFMGIRTPWTLSSEEVWDRTHDVGSRLFMVSGALAVLGTLAEGWLALALIVAPVMMSAIYLVYYSYSEYQKLAIRPVD